MTAVELYLQTQLGHRFNIIDVREIERYDSYHLPGAIWMAKGDIMENYEDLLNKESKYYITCNGGNSAGMIAKMLQDAGYDVEYLIGGMNDLIRYLKEYNPEKVE